MIYSVIYSVNHIILFFNDIITAKTSIDYLQIVNFFIHWRAALGTSPLYHFSTQL